MTTEATPGGTDCAATNQNPNSPAVFGIPNRMASRRPWASSVPHPWATDTSTTTPASPTPARSVASHSGLAEARPTATRG
jgi:hypothetical protein